MTQPDGPRAIEIDETKLLTKPPRHHHRLLVSATRRPHLVAEETKEDPMKKYTKPVVKKVDKPVIISVAA
ncbi:MAG TPA: hypothetical protein VFC19_16055 [Candidatus Limnocylindrales bacterium]|nr:hypothetical protein [Candidatus Limnocylindrales bacterium]